MNLKVHLAVIGVMTLALVGGYSMLHKTPQDTAQNAVKGDHYIRIVHAHWGLNCNKAIQESLRSLTPTSGDAAQAEKPKLVEPNNALSILQQQCERHAECNVPLRPVLLGNPSKQCIKQLDIGWRCFSYDKLQTKTLSEGQTLSIQCH
jgi:hypothetical protein